MKEFEILSRATAFLLQVDPPEQDDDNNIVDSGDTKVKKTSAFPHLKENIDIRNELLRKQDYKYDPASGPRRFPHQLNWLEFCPTNFRPKVHVVASSHVISPFLWPKYYNQDWLKLVTQEHVRYSLEVWGKNNNTSSNNREEDIMMGAQQHDGKLQGSFKPLAKFALNPYPIHHPNEMDVAVIHLKDEDAALEHMKNMGIQPLHVPTMHEFKTSTDPVFEPGERVLFQGFQVYEANSVDQETLSNDDNNNDDDVKKSDGDDERIFHPYSSMGTLAMASPDRFLATTKYPLPEGLCGGPAIILPNEMDTTKNATPLLTIRGVVEGIVPPNHENKELSGMASFLPSYRIREFVDFAERIMLEQIIDKDLFKKVVDLKEKKDQRGTTYQGDEFNLNETDGEDDYDDDDELPNDPNLRAGIEGTSEEDSETPQIDKEYQEIIMSLRKHHTPEEVDAILATVEREREEVIKIMETEGGDMDEAIERVRRKTYDEKERIMKEIEEEMRKGQLTSNIAEGEIVSSKA